jgi:hypothetical protein
MPDDEQAQHDFGGRLDMRYANIGLHLQSTFLCTVRLALILPLDIDVTSMLHPHRVACRSLVNRDSSGSHVN